MRVLTVWIVGRGCGGNLGEQTCRIIIQSNLASDGPGLPLRAQSAPRPLIPPPRERGPRLPRHPHPKAAFHLRRNPLLPQVGPPPLGLLPPPPRRASRSAGRKGKDQDLLLRVLGNETAREQKEKVCVIPTTSYTPLCCHRCPPVARTKQNYYIREEIPAQARVFAKKHQPQLHPSQHLEDQLILKINVPSEAEAASGSRVHLPPPLLRLPRVHPVLGLDHKVLGKRHQQVAPLQFQPQLVPLEHLQRLRQGRPLRLCRVDRRSTTGGLVAETLRKLLGHAKGLQEDQARRLLQDVEAEEQLALIVAERDPRVVHGHPHQEVERDRRQGKWGGGVGQVPEDSEVVGEMLQFLRNELDIFQHFLSECIKTTFDNAIILPRLLFQLLPLPQQRPLLPARPQSLPQRPGDPRFGGRRSQQESQHVLRGQILTAELLGQSGKLGLQEVGFAVLGEGALAEETGDALEEVPDLQGRPV